MLALRECVPRIHYNAISNEEKAKSSSYEIHMCNKQNVHAKVLKHEKIIHIYQLILTKAVHGKMCAKQIDWL